MSYAHPRVTAGYPPWPPEAQLARTSAHRAARFDGIDLLRGLVMILMALDHTRDFFSASGVNPRDVQDPALFLTRWVTHFCAPIFVFLAGLSAYLYGVRGRSRGEVSRFLLTRGFWLIVLEFTLVRVGWTFDLQPDYLITQVIWAIGASMIALSMMVYWPRWTIATVALAMVAGHNALDGISAAQFGGWAWVWHLLHEPALLEFESQASLFAVYPLIPWIGVMAAGYCLGPTYAMADPTDRRRWLIRLGILVTLGFVLLRSGNLYGDPTPWAIHSGWTATLLSFLNCEKYPPSLLYLMMTLGPGLILLAVFERTSGTVARWITVYGRVPLLYYVLHVFLIHGLAIGFAHLTIGSSAWLFGTFPPIKPLDYGVDLPVVYLIALVVVVALYPLCARFAAIKRARPEWWWSYL